MATRYPTTKIMLHPVNQATLNFWFGLILFGLTSATIITTFINIRLHVWFGVAMLLAITLHLILHRELISALLKRFWHGNLPFRWKWVLDIGLLFVFTPVILSGLIVWAIYAPRVSWFHETGAYVFIGAVALHLYVSRKWIINKFQRTWKNFSR